MTDTEKTQTPEELLTELAQLHIRTIVPPTPKHPSAFGWQAIAGCQAAGFARALHALMEVAPGKAAEITDWFQGPFEEGPDPEEHTDWIERTVAGGDVDLLEQWITEARQLAEEEKTNTEAGEKERRRMADEKPAAPAPLASGLPLVKGRCPACGSSSLFLGNGGYVTCSRIDCPEPDAASTSLERSAAGAPQDGARP